MSSRGAGFCVKICGIRSVHDARIAFAAGATAIGLNFVPGRARAIDLVTAREILGERQGRPLLPIIGIVADPDDALLEALSSLQLTALQLHGAETPARCAELLRRNLSVYKAVPVRTEADVIAAQAYPGDRVLFDAAVGGSGQRFDWSWLASAGSRPYWLAGGLTPDNVAEAVTRTHACGVDVASGVEASVGVKDETKVSAFVRNARAAYSAR